MLPLSDATKLTAGLAKDIGASPFRLAPEKAAELYSDVFGGAPPEMVLGDELVEEYTNFAAYPNDNKIEVHSAALLSVWAVSRAALLVGASAMAAVRQNEGALSGDPGSDVDQARELVKAAEALIRDKYAEWPTGLPVPNAAAQEDTFDWYVNNLFLAASGWILLHEIAHIKLGHVKCPVPEGTQRQEREADAWATRWVLDGDVTGLVKEFRVLAVTVGLVWVAILDGVRRGSKSHPHAWERLGEISHELETHELSPALELTTYVMKVLFLEDQQGAEFDNPSAAFFGILIEVSRLPR
jgi:hypothetical protein